MVLIDKFKNFFVILIFIIFSGFLSWINFFKLWDILVLERFLRIFLYFKDL